MYIQENERKWNEVHSIESLRLKYPSEQVIRFVKGNFRDPGKAHILDVGCGSGRHVAYMLEEGYQVSAIDFSEECVQTTLNLTENFNRKGIIAQASAQSLPFRDNFFDGVISHGVLLYLKYQDIAEAINEIYRVLKPEGKALLVVRAVGDKRYGKGEVVERNTFRMVGNQTNEEGMIIHFFEENEIHELCKLFSSINIGFSKSSMNSTREYDYDYLITLEK